jgi:hypothetical protein
MTDGDDLPDHDYASIYGAELLRARQHARQRHMLQHLDTIMAHQDVLIARLDATIARLPPSSAAETP